MQIDITQIVVAVVGLLMTIITSVLIPWIKTKLTAEQLTILSTLTLQTVQGLEIIMKNAIGADKKAAAMRELKEQCEKRGMKFDENIISLEIENAWKNLRLDEK